MAFLHDTVRALHKIESKIPAAHASHVINGKEMIPPFLIHDTAGFRHGSGHGGAGNVPFLEKNRRTVLVTVYVPHFTTLYFLSL
jgi:hypothetical protein